MSVKASAELDRYIKSFECAQFDFEQRHFKTLTKQVEEFDTFNQVKKFLEVKVEETSLRAILIVLRDIRRDLRSKGL